MCNRFALVVLIPAVLATACVPARDSDPAPPTSRIPDGQCDAAPASWAAGLTATDEIVDRAWEDSGARLVRIIHPNDMVTMEYNPDRLNLTLDGADVIREIRCG